MEREARKEFIPRGQLYFLAHPDAEDIFSGFGFTMREGRQDHLLGMVMVDRLQAAEADWLSDIEHVYRQYEVAPMTASGQQVIVCQMKIDRHSLALLRPMYGPIASEIKEALQAALDEPPDLTLKLAWNEAGQLWTSRLWIGLPLELQEVFERTGYGCFPAEMEDRVGFVTHAADEDIERFRDVPVGYHWELIEMPTAPLIRFRAALFDDPSSPYVFEHFLNVEDPYQARVLERLVNQAEIVFDFFGEDFEYAYSKHLPHSEQMRAELHQLVGEAIEYWGEIPEGERDFDRAKAEFQAGMPM